MILRAGAVASPVLIGLALISLAPTLARAETAADIFYDRSVMSIAGTRCGLFEPGLASALMASQAQARNAALRSGASRDSLDAALGRAQGRANAVSCFAPDLKMAADRVRQSFKAYGSQRVMTFPGELAGWKAVRDITESNDAWRLSQSAQSGADRMIFGLAGRQGRDELTVTANFADGAQPYAARLVMRDPARAPQAYIADLNGAAPLADRLPPLSATLAVLADSRGRAALTLLPIGVSTAAAFRFPAEVVSRIANLDPREAVGVDFVFAGPSGDRVRRAVFEVGDFAAGVAFLRAGQR